MFTARVLILIVLMQMSIFLIAQSITFKDAPRTKIDFDKSGYYEMVAQPKSTELDPGQPLDIDVYFSGYGEIKGSKIFFAASKGIFDSTSYVTEDLKRDGNELYWGARTFKIDGKEARFSAALRGISFKNNPKWKISTSYVDASSDSNDLLILTERPAPSPPVFIHMGTNKKSEPGSYSATIVYTYFNGQQWAGGNKEINFRIRNRLERNPGWVFLGSIVGLIIIMQVLVQATMWARESLPYKKLKEAAARIRSKIRR